jgi:hypothetical protein
MRRWLMMMGAVFGLTGIVHAAGSFFRVDAQDSSQYINLDAISAISHNAERSSRPYVDVWIIGSPNPIRIPNDHQTAFWEAMRDHAQCRDAADTLCQWPTGPRASSTRQPRR